MLDGVEETLNNLKTSVRRSFDASSAKQAEETLDGAVQTWKESMRRRLMPTRDEDVLEALELAQRLVDSPWYRASVRATAATVPAVSGLYAVGRRPRHSGYGSSSSDSESGAVGAGTELGNGRTSRRPSGAGLAPSRHAQDVVYLQVASSKDIRRSVRAAFSRKNMDRLSEALFSSAESDLFIKWAPFEEPWEAELALSSCHAAVTQQLGYEPEYNEALYADVSACVIS